MVDFIIIVVFLLLYGAAIIAAGRYLARREARYQRTGTLRDAEHIPPSTVPLVTTSVIAPKTSSSTVMTVVPVLMIGDEMFQKPQSVEDDAAWIASSHGMAGKDASDSATTTGDDAHDAWVKESGGHAGYDAPF